MSDWIERLPEPILVVGGYGYQNVGDEAILAGLLTRLGSRRVTVVSRDPAATAGLHGVPAVGIGGVGVALLRHRSVIIGGGGLFGRDMGSIGRLLPAFGLAAIALRRRVAVAGVDLDNRLSGIARELVPRLLRRARSVAVRDHRSVAICEGWGIHAELEPDLSAWMPAQPAEAGRELLQSAGIDTARPVVGLALTAVRPALADAVLAAAPSVVDALPHVQFCFIPMSRHPRVAEHDDLDLARRLRAVTPRLAVLEGHHHPGAVLSAIGGLSAMISMRYHGMLFAHRMAVPLVPVVYAEKNLRWLSDRGLQPVAPEAGRLTDALRVALRRPAAPTGGGVLVTA